MCQVERRQPVSNTWPVDAERLQGKVEGICGDLPKIGVSSLHCSKPGVLQLLLPPKRGQAANVGTQGIGASLGRGSEVEQRAVGVKHADLHAARCLSVNLIRHSHPAPDLEPRREIDKPARRRIDDRCLDRPVETEHHHRSDCDKQ
jgi:hypothetical protein